MLRVIEEGFFSTVQDKGRFGYRHIGVPVSGTMDAYAAHLANSLLENDKGDALLEFTMIGPKLKFEEPTSIALTGASMTPYINGEANEINTVITVKAGDVLTLDKPKDGLRTYLAVKGGLESEKVMGSRSYYVPITEERKLRPGMEIPYKPVEAYKPKISEIQPSMKFSDFLFEVLPGPEFDLLDDVQKEQLLEGDFHIAKENNRMAYQLEESIASHQISMLTSATLPGTVQLTPAGKPIILMRDAQTTGGYPRVLQLNESAISRLAQKKQGDLIRFRLTN